MVDRAILTYLQVKVGRGKTEGLAEGRPTQVHRVMEAPVSSEVARPLTSTYLQAREVAEVNSHPAAMERLEQDLEVVVYRQIALCSHF